MSYYIGIDIGGTFTDCAVLDDTGRIVTIAKSPTRRDAQDVGVMEAVAAAARHLDLGVRDLLSQCRFFIHGCTVATNAIVERKGARTALVATLGHEQAFLIGKASQKIAGLTNAEMTHQSHLDKADPPLVPPGHIFGLPERVDRSGSVVAPLSEAALDDLVDRLREERIESVAICFLWSFLNDVHEVRVRGRLAAALTDVYICTSHEIAPVIGEYERMATTVANAYVAPRLNSYLSRLERRLGEMGYTYPLLLAHCMGGLTTMEEIRARPLLMLDSGPVSGVLGARFFGAAYGKPNIICADMGGTTFDVGLVENGRYILDEEPVVDRYTCAIPKVAVESVGAGGGSLVWIDENDMLRVGPRSAGADPGPACYGHGGTEPAITDVNLLLGYIDADNFLGGEMKLDANAARLAVEGLARRLGMDTLALAAGAYRIVNAHMADLIRRVSIDRGKDPRDFVLFAYGGAGPLHIAYLARDLGIGEIYVPSFATVFSAMGMLTGGILHGAERSCVLTSPLDAQGYHHLLEAFGDLEARISVLFDAEHVGTADRSIERFVHMKYRLQPGAIAVPFRASDDIQPSAQDLLLAFEQRYRDLFGANAGLRNVGVEIVKVSVEAASRTVAPRLAPSSVDESLDARSAVKGERPVYFVEVGQHAPTPIYDGSRLRPGMKLHGPAVIERMGDSIVLPTFASALVDAFDNVVIRLAAHDDRGVQ